MPGTLAWARRPMPYRPARRAAATLPPPHISRGPSRRECAWRDSNSAAVEFDDLSCQQLTHQGDIFVRDASTTTDILTELLVFLRAVTETKCERRAASADDVNHGHFLGQADRVIERKDDHRVYCQPTGP